MIRIITWKHGFVGSVGSRNSKHETWNMKYGTQNTDHGTQKTDHGKIMEYGTQNTEHGTRNTEHKTRIMKHLSSFIFFYIYCHSLTTTLT